MRISIQSFLPTLAAAMALAMVGCGGGSRSSEVVPASGTVVKAWTNADGVNYPKHMVFLNGNLYISNNGSIAGNVDDDQILKIDSNGLMSLYSTVGEPIGITVNNNTLFVTGRDPGTDSTGLLQLNPIASAPKAATSVNYYGVVFSATKIYLVDGANINVLNADFSPSAPSTINLTNSAPQGLLINGNRLFISNTDGSISTIDTATNTLAIDLFPVNSFARPNAMVLDGLGNMYVANAGSGLGEGGSISKVNLTTLVKETFVTASQVGLCGAAGLAIDNGYIYVSNGTCSTASLHHRILKIKL